MARQEFLLPDVGEGLTEADILQWKVTVGDIVTLNQPLVEIETEKAVVELPSPFEGTIVALHGEPGQTIAVGTAIVEVEVASAPANQPDAPRQAVLVGYGVANETEVATRTRRRRGAASATSSTAPVPTSAPLSTPPVRLYAKSHGIDLATVSGTGPGGVITRHDVEALVNTRASIPTPTREPHGRPFNGVQLASWGEGSSEERIAVRGVVKSMAESMTKSATQIPQACVWLTVDVTAMTSLLRGIRERQGTDGVRITPTTILAMAMIDGARHYPGINSYFDVAANEIVVRRTVNLGIAADTPRGLIVPNIKGADRLSLLALAQAMHELVGTARAGATTPAAMSGTTLTITNVGPFSVDAAMPLLPPDTGAIVAMGRVSPRPWVHEGEVAVRDVVELAMTFDHRMIDGALASLYLAHVGRYISDPTPSLLLNL